MIGKAAAAERCLASLLNTLQGFNDRLERIEAAEVERSGGAGLAVMRDG
jgi:hypothetical protein